MNILATNTEKTESTGKELALSLLKKGKKQAFIALFGEMGVGKTAFVRGFCSALGISSVKSPTYTIVNEYVRGSHPVFHFDMYRVGDEDDLVSIGYYDYLARDGFCLCEWSENIVEFIPNEAITVTISKTDGDEDERIIKIEEHTEK
jgi:tRNA threonylcarbamoyladenosine biosynthesis protein TsaE